MKILFLTPQLPYPPKSGGVIKSHKLVSYLSERHQLSLACLLKGDDTYFVEEFSKKFKLNKFVTQTIDLKRSLTNFIKSLFLGIPLTVLRNRCEDFEEKLQPLFKEVDLVFVDHYVMFQYIPDDFQGKIILHQHNAEYVLWLRYAEQTRNPLKRLLLTFESLRIRRFERLIGERAQTIVASPNDKEELMKLGLPEEKFVLTWHLGDEELLDKPEIQFKDTKKVLLSIGTLSWEPNKDGLKWFIKEVWQKVKSLHPDVELWVGGKGADSDLLQLVSQEPQIKMLGFVDDLEVYHKVARVFIAPLRFGSGIKVKVINALYRGLPVVTTSIGVEGMEVTPGQHLFVSDKASEMVESLDSLLKDEFSWTRMAKEGRTLVREKYTWKKVFDELEKVL